MNTTEVGGPSGQPSASSPDEEQREFERADTIVADQSQPPTVAEPTTSNPALAATQPGDADAPEVIEEEDESEDEEEDESEESEEEDESEDEEEDESEDEEEDESEESEEEGGGEGDDEEGGEEPSQGA